MSFSSNVNLGTSPNSNYTIDKVIPRELIEIIAEYLPNQDFLGIFLASKYLSKILSNQRNERSFITQIFPTPPQSHTIGKQLIFFYIRICRNINDVQTKKILTRLGLPAIQTDVKPTDFMGLISTRSTEPYRVGTYNQSTFTPPVDFLNSVLQTLKLCFDLDSIMCTRLPNNCCRVVTQPGSSSSSSGASSSSSSSSTSSNSGNSASSSSSSSSSTSSNSENPNNDNDDDSINYWYDTKESGWYININCAPLRYSGKVSELPDELDIKRFFPTDSKININAVNIDAQALKIGLFKSLFSRLSCGVDLAFLFQELVLCTVLVFFTSDYAESIRSFTLAYPSYLRLYCNPNNSTNNNRLPCNADLNIDLLQKLRWLTSLMITHPNDPTSVDELKRLVVHNLPLHKQFSTIGYDLCKIIWKKIDILVSDGRDSVIIPNFFLRMLHNAIDSTGFCEHPLQESTKDISVSLKSKFPSLFDRSTIAKILLTGEFLLCVDILYGSWHENGKFLKTLIAFSNIIIPKLKQIDEVDKETFINFFDAFLEPNGTTGEHGEFAKIVMPRFRKFFLYVMHVLKPKNINSVIAELNAMTPNAILAVIQCNELMTLQDPRTCLGLILDNKQHDQEHINRVIFMLSALYAIKGSALLFNGLTYKYMNQLVDIFTSGERCLLSSASGESFRSMDQICTFAFIYSDFAELSKRFGGCVGDNLVQKLIENNFFAETLPYILCNRPNGALTHKQLPYLLSTRIGRATALQIWELLFWFVTSTPKANVEISQPIMPELNQTQKLLQGYLNDVHTINAGDTFICMLSAIAFSITHEDFGLARDNEPINLLIIIIYKAIKPVNNSDDLIDNAFRMLRAATFSSWLRLSGLNILSKLDFSGLNDSYPLHTIITLEEGVSIEICAANFGNLLYNTCQLIKFWQLNQEQVDKFTLKPNSSIWSVLIDPNSPDCKNLMKYTKSGQLSFDQVFGVGSDPQTVIRAMATANTLITAIPQPADEPPASKKNMHLPPNGNIPGPNKQRKIDDDDVVVPTTGTNLASNTSSSSSSTTSVSQPFKIMPYNNGALIFSMSSSSASASASSSSSSSSTIPETSPRPLSRLFPRLFPPVAATPPSTSTSSTSTSSTSTSSGTGNNHDLHR